MQIGYRETPKKPPPQIHSKWSWEIRQTCKYIESNILSVHSCNQYLIFRTVVETFPTTHGFRIVPQALFYFDQSHMRLFTMSTLIKAEVKIYREVCWTCTWLNADFETTVAFEKSPAHPEIFGQFKFPLSYQYFLLVRWFPKSQINCQVTVCVQLPSLLKWHVLACFYLFTTVTAFKKCGPLKSGTRPAFILFDLTHWSAIVLTGIREF